MTSLTRNISRSNLTISLPLWKNPRWLAVRFQNVPIWPNRLSYYSKTSNIIPRSNLPIHKLRRNLKFWPKTLWKKIHDGCRWNFKISLCGRSTMSKTRASGFIRFPNARKHLKPQGRRPSGFIVFKPLETWWNLKHEFLKWLLQRNNPKWCSVVFFPFFCKMHCMCGLLYSVGIHYICELLFLINQ